MTESTSKDTTLRWRNLKTGLLFLFGLLILGWLGFFVGKNTGLLSPHHTLTIFVADSRGLQEGNFVGISGKKVGTIVRIDFKREHDTNGVLITLDILGAENFAMITKDSKAVIKGMGILGDQIVNIQLGTSKDLVQDGDQLPVSTEPGIADLTNNAIHAMRNVNELTDKLNQGQGTLGKLITSDSLGRQIQATISTMNTAVERLYVGNGVLPKLMNDGAFADQVQSTVQNLNSITSTMKEGNGAAGKMILGDDLLQKLTNVSARTDSLLTTLNDQNGSLAKFSHNPSLYDNMNKSLTNAQNALNSLDSLLIDFKKNPNRYVHVSVF